MNLSEKLWYLNMAMGIYGCGMYIFLNVIAKSEMPVENLGDEPTSAPICDMGDECHQQLQNRLETIESAVRAIVSILSIQKSELFTTVNKMLEQDQAVREILSRSECIQNFGSGLNAAVEENPSDATKDFSQDGKSVEHLKGAIKCSLANLIDISTKDHDLKANQSDAHIKASVMTNGSLNITWPILSADCLKFSSGVWIRIYQASEGDDNKLPEEATAITALSIPQKCCLVNKDAASYSIVLFPQSPSADEKDSCFFSMTKNLTQCSAYVVEVIPNYQSLCGKTLRTEMVIPPNKQSDESSTKPLISVIMAHQSNSLVFNWEDNSGCAPQLTSFNLKIFRDGIADKEKAITTISVPRSCLQHLRKNENLFSLELPADRQTCPIDWKPLDTCRKYRLDVSSQYSAWNSPSSSWEIFTGQEGNYPVNISDFWRCPKDHYYCPFHGRCQQIQSISICQSDVQCDDGRDEKHCNTECNKERFRCGQQCLPKDLVCDGKYDCLDGSDEGYDCSYAYVCQQFTNASGKFSSRIFPKPAFEIHPDRVPDAVRKTAVLISVQPGHQIWLTFNKFVTYKDKHFIKVYDGPYSSSPLLLSHSGLSKPYSVRSSSSDLFVEFPSYHDPNYGIEAFYTSVNLTDESFVPGCGGYINGEGVISTPNYLSAATSRDDCFWFIESWNSEDSFLLRKYSFDFITSKMTPVLSHFIYPTITVYDGWSTDSLVLYDGKPSNEQDNAVIFSITNKMLVHLKQPKVINEYRTFYWNVSKISSSKCKYYYEGTSGTIKSPNYPMLYPHLTDCRWTISVKPGSKVRLLFAFFETQEGSDFLSVYDGTTVHSKLLLAKSGSVPTPFVVNSSTNQVMVRFTSDGDTSFPGFLAVYSSLSNYVLDLPKSA
ncbi:uncharacterized protein LOC124204036 isoform X2 [Daphnia pulex]|uniref:uncharacterized protein LOC124204036 isoform X2 n=1 Tax=Daphnia pulex TaxID=6669 RepID=UPI001EDDFC90|nr:uncharacterized protein LOC124204036 isoform X2 [Daphnia pulex]